MPIFGFLGRMRAGFTNFRDQQRQKKAVENFTEHLLDLPGFFGLTILAGIIAGFGLLQGNEPVLIGAMIITPFITPLVGITLALFARDGQLFLKALLRSAGGIVLFFLVTYIVGGFFSSGEINNSFLLRANSVSMADIFIATAAGLVAALALASTKIQNRLTGAAIAISLAPPLAVAAIALGLQETEIFQNALVVFGINVAGILLMSLVVFWIFGFHRKAEATPEITA